MLFSGVTTKQKRLRLSSDQRVLSIAVMCAWDKAESLVDFHRLSLSCIEEDAATERRYFCWMCIKRLMQGYWLIFSVIQTAYFQDVHPIVQHALNISYYGITSCTGCTSSTCQCGSTFANPQCTSHAVYKAWNQRLLHWNIKDASACCNIDQC